MGELIDRNAAIERLDQRAKLMTGEKVVSVDSVRVFLQNRPTVDAVPVVHGEWLQGWCSFPMCSVCKEMIATSASRYCPNCGAKMDGWRGIANQEKEDNKKK